MKRMKAGDFPQEVLNVFDHYVHGEIGRREFIERAAKFAIGGMKDLMAAVPFLASTPQWNGRVGAVGFCFGGTVVNQMAVRAITSLSGIHVPERQPRLP